MMELSEFKIIECEKTHLYYDKYQYRVSVLIDFAYLARNAIKQSKTKEQTVELISYKITDSFRGAKILASLKDTFDVFVDWYYNSIDKFDNSKVIFGWNNFTVYTNDVSLIYELKDNLFLKLLALDLVKDTAFEILRVKLHPISIGKDIILQKNPVHKFRVYLKARVQDGDSRKEMKEWLSRYTDKIHQSPSLEYFLDYGGTYWGRTAQAKSQAAESHFIDCKEESFVMLLSMKYQEIIRKICKIEKR